MAPSHPEPIADVVQQNAHVVRPGRSYAQKDEPLLASRADRIPYLSPLSPDAYASSARIWKPIGVGAQETQAIRNPMRRIRTWPFG